MLMKDKIERWWRLRRVRKAWQRMQPGEQLAMWLKLLDENPALREQFQQALRVKGFDRTVRGPR